MMTARLTRLREPFQVFQLRDQNISLAADGFKSAERSDRWLRLHFVSPGEVRQASPYSTVPLRWLREGYTCLFDQIHNTIRRGGRIMAHDLLSQASIFRDENRHILSMLIVEYFSSSGDQEAEVGPEFINSVRISSFTRSSTSSWLAVEKSV
jgi:hypothetical protein